MTRLESYLSIGVYKHVRAVDGLKGASCIVDIYVHDIVRHGF